MEERPFIIGDKPSKKGQIIHKAKIRSIGINRDGVLTKVRVNDEAMLNLYEKIERAYGRERVVPTLALMFAAKDYDMIEGEIMCKVPIIYGDELAYNDKGNIIYRKITAQEVFCGDAESYALHSRLFTLKWNGSKSMLAIFANLCIGGGWGVKSCGKELYISYVDAGVKFRDIWSETFEIENGLVGVYHQCFSRKLQIKSNLLDLLFKIQVKAEMYLDVFRQAGIIRRDC